MFGEGISRSGEIIDLGVEHGIIQKSGSWFSYNGSKIAQGRDQAKRMLQDNPELAAELEEKSWEALRATAPGKKGKADKKEADSDKESKAPRLDRARRLTGRAGPRHSPRRLLNRRGSVILIVKK